MNEPLKKISESIDFKNAGDAYIHAEMKGGSRVETIIHGDQKALMWVAMHVVGHLSEKTGASFTEVCGLLNALHMSKGSDKDATKAKV